MTKRIFIGKNGLNANMTLYSGGNVKVQLESGDPVLSLTSLKSLAEKLPEDLFFRVGKSHIVNLSKVQTLERHRIVFGNTYIPISEPLRDEFYRRLSRYSILPQP